LICKVVVLSDYILGPAQYERAALPVGLWQVRLHRTLPPVLTALAAAAGGCSGARRAAVAGKRMGTTKNGREGCCVDILPSRCRMIQSRRRYSFILNTGDQPRDSMRL
jgi:hypothetical protein